MLKMASSGMDPNREMALFRFSMVAPAIQNTYSDDSASAYFRRVTAVPLRRPDGTEFQYTPKTLEKWAALYKNGGLDALTPTTRSDKGRVRALSGDCISEIYNIREKFPKLGSTQIHLRLFQMGLITDSVSVRTVQRFVKNNGLKKGCAPGAPKDRKAFEEAYFGGMWMADSCYFPYIREDGQNRRTYLVAIVDDHSRLVVGARLFYEDNAYNFQKVLKSAIATYGVPKKLYVDSGGPYKNAQLSYICAEAGIVLIHAPVRDGAAKGKVERTFGTFKSRWLHGFDTGTLTSLDEFNRELDIYTREHNTTLNSSTGATPMDRFMATRDHAPAPRSAERLDNCFMNRATCKVRPDSTLTFSKTQFDAPIQFIGHKVEVRFLPDRMEDAFIFDAGIRFPLKLTDKVANGKAQREKGPTIDYSRGGDE
jgi:transposase InsO family protein